MGSGRKDGPQAEENGAIVEFVSRIFLLGSVFVCTDVCCVVIAVLLCCCVLLCSFSSQSYSELMEQIGLDTRGVRVSRDTQLRSLCTSPSQTVRKSLSE